MIVEPPMICIAPLRGGNNDRRLSQLNTHDAARLGIPALRRRAHLDVKYFPACEGHKSLEEMDIRSGF